MTKQDDKGLPVLPPGTSGAMGDMTGAATTIVGIGGKIIKALANARTRREMDDTRELEAAEHARTLAAPPPIHGSARWATAADLQSKDYLRTASEFEKPDARNILLGGMLSGSRMDWLYWDSDGHLMTVAPTRTGKSTMLIIPNLLRYKGSCVVLDPKGELYQKTSKWRAENVGPVYRIAPFEDSTHAFNPLSTVKSASDARALADMMIPEDPHAPQFFRKDAIGFLTGLILFMVKTLPKEYATIAQLRRLTSERIDRFLNLAKAMSESDIPAARNAGNIVIGKNRERGLPNLIDTLGTELSIWDDEGVARASNGFDVDFHDLKDRPGTVYITFPFSKMEAFAPFLRVLLASALDAMVQNQNEPEIPVLFVLDEFLSLGTYPKFRDAVRTHASAGVRLWFFLQNVAMLEELYPTSWKTFYDAAVQTYFGTTDPFTAKLISDTTDDTTVAQLQSTFTLGKSVSREDFFDTGSGDSINVTHSVNLSGRRLITPGEVVQTLSDFNADGSRQMITNLKGVPPILGRLVPYYLGAKASERIGMMP